MLDLLDILSAMHQTLGDLAIYDEQHPRWRERCNQMHDSALLIGRLRHQLAPDLYPVPLPDRLKTPADVLQDVFGVVSLRPERGD